MPAGVSMYRGGSAVPTSPTCRRVCAFDLGPIWPAAACAAPRVAFGAFDGLLAYCFSTRFLAAGHGLAVDPEMCTRVGGMTRKLQVSSKFSLGSRSAWNDSHAELKSETNSRSLLPIKVSWALWSWQRDRPKSIVRGRPPEDNSECRRRRRGSCAVVARRSDEGRSRRR